MHRAPDDPAVLALTEAIAAGDPDWVGSDDLTPRAAAEQGGHADVVAVLDGLA